MDALLSALSGAGLPDAGWLAAVGLVAFAGLVMLLRRRRYRPQPSLLSPAEATFHRVLVEAAAGRWAVLPKVRVADVITPRGREGSPRWWAAFRPIAAKHLDFVLADARTWQPVAAIELDDASHRRRDRRTRDRLLNRAMAQAGVPLIRVAAAGRRGYHREALRTEIERALKA